MSEGKGKLVVISGPSGVGKTSVVKEVGKRCQCWFSVSATTRLPRQGEVDGRDYHFVDRKTFEKMIADKQLLEWAEVYGNLYGTPAEPVRQAVADGKTAVLDIDVQGGLQVHEVAPQATFILLLPPSEEELARRLNGRGSEDEQTSRRRLAKARAEIELARKSGFYTHEVVNRELEETIRKVLQIVTC